MPTTNQIQNAIQNGYEFRTGHYISKSFEFFKERAGEFIGFTVVYLIISLITGVIPIVGTLISIVISGPLSLGAVIYTHKMQNDQDLAFAGFFDGFKKFTNLFVTYLFQILIYIILAIPLFIMVGFEVLQAVMSGDEESVLEFGKIIVGSLSIFAVMGVVFLYVGISLRWSLHLAYFFNYSPLEAIKESFVIVNKRWFAHFGFILFCILIGLLGILALFIGLLVAIPIISISDYIGFAEVTGLNEEEQVEDFKEFGNIDDIS
ncbi:MAG: hypothetical protein IPL63_16015 [Saprospiraceae bacterium]|nr:hypothetical protein [Saprospiraceae bacterium]MBK6564834.1 hypothetical protein [Saprospiraceae bacterium]MBK6782972.1 hypothetical protein [Saprospiraceae bacterium]MBK7523477.1 hypothetical protein [Saprospiraceae bacterium]MBK8371534.1 hypothetical protein [Saprospiraceae bacterium]